MEISVITPPEDSPEQITLVKLSPEQQEEMERRITEHDARRQPLTYVEKQVPSTVLDGLAVGDMFLFRVKMAYQQRVRRHLQLLAKDKGWYLYIQIDPTAAPPSGYTDLYGYVQELAASP